MVCALNSCVLLCSEIIKDIFPVSVKIEQSVDVPFSVSLPALDSSCTFRGQVQACWESFSFRVPAACPCGSGGEPHLGQPGQDGRAVEGDDCSLLSSASEAPSNTASSFASSAHG